MSSVIDSNVRAEIIRGWLREQSRMSQRQYLAKVERETGLTVSPRTLRSWLQRLDSAGNPRLSELVRDAFATVARVEATLGEMLQVIANDSAPSTAAACESPPQLAPTVTPISKASGTANGGKRPLFDWDMDE